MAAINKRLFPSATQSISKCDELLLAYLRCSMFPELKDHLPIRPRNDAILYTCALYRLHINDPLLYISRDGKRTRAILGINSGIFYDGGRRNA